MLKKNLNHITLWIKGAAKHGQAVQEWKMSFTDNFGHGDLAEVVSMQKQVVFRHASLVYSLHSSHFCWNIPNKVPFQVKSKQFCENLLCSYDLLGEVTCSDVGNYLSYKGYMVLSWLWIMLLTQLWNAGKCIRAKCHQKEWAITGFMWCQVEVYPWLFSVVHLFTCKNPQTTLFSLSMCSLPPIN